MDPCLNYKVMGGGGGGGGLYERVSRVTRRFYGIKKYLFSKYFSLNLEKCEGLLIESIGTHGPKEPQEQ